MPLLLKLHIHHCTFSAGIQMWAIRPRCTIMLPPIYETWLNKNKSAPPSKCTQPFPVRQWLALAGRSREYFPNSWFKYMPRRCPDCMLGHVLSPTSPRFPLTRLMWRALPLRLVGSNVMQHPFFLRPHRYPIRTMRKKGPLWSIRYPRGQRQLFGLNSPRSVSRIVLSLSWTWCLPDILEEKLSFPLAVSSVMKSQEKEKKKKKAQLGKASLLERKV